MMNPVMDSGANIAPTCHISAEKPIAYIHGEHQAFIHTNSKGQLIAGVW